MRHLWELETVVFLHQCLLIHAVLVYLGFDILAGTRIKKLVSSKAGSGTSFTWSRIAPSWLGRQTLLRPEPWIDPNLTKPSPTLAFVTGENIIFCANC
jgi:hypothetical protein